MLSVTRRARIAALTLPVTACVCAVALLFTVGCAAPAGSDLDGPNSDESHAVEPRSDGGTTAEWAPTDVPGESLETLDPVAGPHVFTAPDGTASLTLTYWPTRTWTIAREGRPDGQ